MKYVTIISTLVIALIVGGCAANDGELDDSIEQLASQVEGEAVENSDGYFDVFIETVPSAYYTLSAENQSVLLTTAGDRLVSQALSEESSGRGVRPGGPRAYPYKYNMVTARRYHLPPRHK